MIVGMENLKREIFETDNMSRTIKTGGSFRSEAIKESALIGSNVRRDIREFDIVFRKIRIFCMGLDIRSILELGSARLTNDGGDGGSGDGGGFRDLSWFKRTSGGGRGERRR